MSNCLSAKVRPFSLVRMNGAFVVRLTNAKGRELGRRELQTRDGAIRLCAYLAGKDRLGTLTVSDLEFSGDLFSGAVL